MIGTKEIKMVTIGKKLVDKYNSNFAEFTSHEFCIRLLLVDFNTDKSETREFLVNSDNWMDYLNDGVDFGDYRIMKIEAFIPKA